MRLPLLIACLYACGCAAPASSTAREQRAGEPESLAPTLRDDWRALSPVAFEAWVAGELAPRGPYELSADDTAALASALDEPGASGVRAAVILGQARTRAGAAPLLAHLERRVLHEELYGDAADVVAARALLGFPERDAFAERLEALAAGPEPHPDLEVRVECAASALVLGRDGGVKVLLGVLLLGTSASPERALGLQPSPTTAWARGRASQALAQHAGMTNPYRADAPLDERVAAVRILRAALLR